MTDAALGDADGFLPPSRVISVDKGGTKVLIGIIINRRGVRCFGGNKERGRYRDMAMKRVIQAIVIMTVLAGTMPALAQYATDPYIEGYVGGNVTLPMGHIKNDLVPDSLNATAALGFNAGVGYHLKPKMVIGLFFDLRNMKTKDLELNHRVYEVGVYGKYFMADITETRFSPYARVSAGMNISKLVTRVEDSFGPVFRELSYNPSLGVGACLGLHIRTNDYGALYVEGSYNYDFMNGVSGKFKGVSYTWDKNNQFVVIRAGVKFNIGPKD
jgi:hypothetical protein